MKAPILSVIIVSFNTAAFTVQTIRSVFASLEPGGISRNEIEVIVVDNNSADDSVKQIKKRFDGKIRIIQNQENTGFAKANNQGVEAAKGEFVILLNSDTIVHPGAFGRMINALRADQFLGIASPKLVNPNGSFQPQGGQLPTLLNVWAWWMWPFAGLMPLVRPYQDPRHLAKVEFEHRGWVGGTALMISKTLYTKLGGLDSRIFMYAEDIDLCMKAAKAGYHVGIVPGAVVTHIGSASGSSLKAKLGEVKGLLYVFGKHKPGWQLFLLRIIFLKGAILRYLYFGILKGDRSSQELYTQIMSAVIR